jgi:plasmid stabilization system protein ParE
MSYRFSAYASDDLAALLYDLAERAGSWAVSTRMEQKLFVAFEDIARQPGIGHLRQDLLPYPIYFLYVEPYLILYERDTSPVVILGILHGARDIQTIMRDRL